MRVTTLILLAVTALIAAAYIIGGTDNTGNAGSIDSEEKNVNNNLLEWPLDCVPGDGKCLSKIGYPDINNNGVAHDCSFPGYQGHQGTDIGITDQALREGMVVRAANAGIVLWVFDGKFDQCPSNHADCQNPGEDWWVPGQSNGFRVCTTAEYSCNDGTVGCFYCFDGGNVVVIEHPDNPDVHATRYDHLKTHSILVSPGDQVTAGQKIAEAASAGNSTGPHLHFEVWDKGLYELADPWVGSCGPNTDKALWKNDPPWQSDS